MDFSPRSPRFNCFVLNDAMEDEDLKYDSLETTHVQYLPEDLDQETGIPGRITNEDETIVFQSAGITITRLNDGIHVARTMYLTVISHPMMSRQIILSRSIMGESCYRRSTPNSRAVWFESESFELAIRRALRVFRCDCLEVFE